MGSPSPRRLLPGGVVAGQGLRKSVVCASPSRSIQTWNQATAGCQSLGVAAPSRCRQLLRPSRPPPGAGGATKKKKKKKKPGGVGKGATPRGGLRGAGEGKERRGAATLRT